MNPDDTKLKNMMREARVSPSLPSRFQENVWRRIEDAETPARDVTWLEAFLALTLRPKFAYATIAVVMLAGILLGAHQGAQMARHDAEARYLASVAPNSLR